MSCRSTESNRNRTI